MARFPHRYSLCRLWALLSVILISSQNLVAAEAPTGLQSQPRPIVSREVVMRWDFDGNPRGWVKEHESSLDGRDERLVWEDGEWSEAEVEFAI